MPSLLSLLYAYLLGGFTFIPLVIIAFIYLHPTQHEPTPEPSLKAAEIEESAQTGLGCFKQGWIYVTHEYMESQDDIPAKTETVGESAEAKSAYSSLYKLVTNNSKAGNSDTSVASDSASTHTVTSPVPIVPPLSPSAAPKSSAATKRHRYYAVLKHGNLFLYKNEKMQNVKHVIVLANHIVSLWPRSLSEASLYTKYSSIAILKADWSRKRRLSDNDMEAFGDADSITVADVLRSDSMPAPSGTVFIYTDLNIEKEDWYFALIRATKSDSVKNVSVDPTVQAKTLHFDTKDAINLIQTLYSSEGQLQTKWFNAIMGRLFLSLQKTDFMRNYLVAKIEKKLNKIKTPDFLEKFQITKVDAGTSAPFITFPVLKEINPEGEMVVSFNVHYAGSMSIQLATKVNINLGSRFKTREVDVLLSITLERMDGPMLLKFKPPPSSRMWYTYEQEPSMSLKIEPVISARQMSYNIITNSIEKKFKEAIKESLVLPHWDDLVFYQSDGEVFRGGVWDKDARENSAASSDTKSAPVNEQDAHSPETVPADEKSVFSVESEDSRVDPIALVNAPAPTNSKTKLSTTITDFSKKLRKPKSTHTIGVDETNCLSDGSVVKTDKSSISSESLTLESKFDNAALRKIGTWYSKLEKTGSGSVKTASASASTTGASYQPPEMISNRRPRKQSSATLTSDPEKNVDNLVFDFGLEHTDNRVRPGDIGATTPEPHPVNDVAKHKPKSASVSTFDSGRSIAEDSVNGNPISPAVIPSNPEVANLDAPDFKRSSSHRKPPPDLVLEEDSAELQSRISNE